MKFGIDPEFTSLTDLGAGLEYIEFIRKSEFTLLCVAIRILGFQNKTGAFNGMGLSYQSSVSLESKTNFSEYRHVNYGPKEIQSALVYLRSVLNLPTDTDLESEFAVGKHPSLLTYEKLSSENQSIIAIRKYLIGASSFLRQPSIYYDIFKAGRSTFLIWRLYSAVKNLKDRKVCGLDDRLHRLIHINEFDRCDALLFEIITAAAYSQNPHVDSVEFVPESKVTVTPDILISAFGYESAVECKKIDRAQENAIQIRNTVSVLSNQIIDEFKRNHKSVLCELILNRDPAEIDASILVNATKESLMLGKRVDKLQFSIECRNLEDYQSKHLALFPSPQFYQDRYGYRIRSGWFGIVNGIHANFVSPYPPYFSLGSEHGSWFYQLHWDCAVKWRIDSDQIIAKYRRFNFSGLFHGIDQIERYPHNSVVHLWVESDYFHEGRTFPLRDLRQRLLATPDREFGWVIVNETLADVSPKGRFDTIEQAHFIPGSRSLTREPVISGVFMEKNSYGGITEFGIGEKLPDIDE